jgi:hypothetical protein
LRAPWKMNDSSYSICALNRQMCQSDDGDGPRRDRRRATPRKR